MARTRAVIRRGLFLVLPDRVHEALQAAYFGYWWLPRAGDGDEPDLRPMRALLRPGDSCIDGGANFGRFADAMADAVGREGHIVAVEPIPRTARLLRRVMRHRLRTSVEVAEVALADAPGTARMEVPAGPKGDANFFRARIADEGGEHGIEVRLDTLDNVAAGLKQPVAFVKLDLEGHERHALAGATRLLEAGAAWLIEMNDDPDDPASDAHAIEALFVARGYRPFVYNEGRRAVAPRSTGPRGPNIFFLLPDHLSRLTLAGVAADM